MSTVSIGDFTCKFSMNTFKWKCDSRALTGLTNALMPKDFSSPSNPNIASTAARILKKELGAKIIFEPETEPIDEEVIY